MNPTMQAVVIHDREDYRLERIPVPVPGPALRAFLPLQHTFVELFVTEFLL